LSVTVKIPTPLRSVTNGQDTVSATASRVGDCLDALERDYPGLRERVCDERGEIRRFVNIYVNGEDIRFLQGLATPLKPGDEVSIVPAVAGG